MIVFEYLWLFLLLLLPLAIYFLVPPYASNRSALKVNFFKRLQEASNERETSSITISKASRMQQVLTIVVMVLVVTALAKPQYIGEPIVKEEPMRDLLVAIDLSGSMSTKDFTSVDGEKIDRLQAVKEVLKQFLEQRKSERIGLIFFGSAAFVQAPFTQDLKALQRLLDEAQVGMAGPQTMLGDAIGLGVKMFEESRVEERMLILMSDGDDTGSLVPPKKAAQLAAQMGVKIYSVAVGDPENAGEHPLDTQTLKEIVEATNGAFYYAYNRKELGEIYTEIDKLTPKIVKEHSFRPRTELFIWPLSAALFLIFMYALTVVLSSKRGVKSA